MKMIVRKNMDNDSAVIESKATILFKILSIFLVFIGVGGFFQTLLKGDTNENRALIVFTVILSLGLFFWGLKLKMIVENKIVKIVSIYGIVIPIKTIWYSDFEYIKIFSDMTDTSGATDTAFFLCDIFSHQTEKLGIFRNPIFPTYIQFESLDDLPEKEGCVSFALNLRRISNLPIKIDEKSIVSYAGVEEYNKAQKLMGLSN